MDKIVLDTDIIIDHVHGQARWLDELLKQKTSELIVPTIVMAEYHSAQELETPVAQVLGTILRRKTYAVGAGTADLMIAATALYVDAPLATKNKAHFHSIPGLRFFDMKKEQTLTTTLGNQNQ